MKRKLFKVMLISLSSFLLIGCSNFDASIGENGNWIINDSDTGIPSKGDKGETGNGIVSITKTSTEGNIDTYTIIFSDGTSTTFNVTNGKNGIDGIQGEPGKDGHTPIITIGSDGYWYIDGISTGIKAQGEKGEKGNPGNDGRSIVSILLTSKDGNKDIYTITYSDNTTSTFEVVNGEQGIQGIQGEPGKDGHTPVITIGSDGCWYIDGVSTGIKAQGEKGEDGNGIVSISKTSSVGNVDIYTITFTDGTTTVFTITNGVDGTQGIQGVPGEDGHTPVITIGNDGCWYIDGVSTGIKAQGDKGDKGNGIVSITKTESIGNVDIYTILYDDGSSTVFTVTNGEDGVDGIQGEPGKDGHTPVITIGENGNWYIDGVDSGKSSCGEKGDTGNGISDVQVEYETDENGDVYLVFTFYFTDENMEPIIQKIKQEKKIINGGSLIKTEYLLLEEGEENYKFNIMVGYDDCSTGVIELDEKYIIKNNVNFYVPGIYALEYQFLGELYSYEISIISQEAKDHRNTLISDLNEKFNLLKSIKTIDKLTYNSLINELNKQVLIEEMDVLYEEILYYLCELGYIAEDATIRPYKVNATIEVNFFNVSDSAEEQEKSIIEYNGKFTPSTAIEYAYNNEAFEVLACEAGSITEVKEDPLFGKMVYLKGNKGYTFMYGSLSDVNVAVGDVVFPGQVIANAGVNTIHATLNNHLHFAVVDESSNAIDPEDYFATNLN